MLVPMRTMPVDRTSSVEVISTARAQRRQRRTSTEATGRDITSMDESEPVVEYDLDEDTEEDTEEELP